MVALWGRCQDFRRMRFRADGSWFISVPHISRWIKNLTLSRPQISSGNWRHDGLELIHSIYPIIYLQEVVLFWVNNANDQFNPNNAPAQGFLNTYLDALDGSFCSYSAFGETGDDPTLDPVYPDPRPNGYKGTTMCSTYIHTHQCDFIFLRDLEVGLPVFY